MFTDSYYDKEILFSKNNKSSLALYTDKFKYTDKYIL